jgi:hypothetical protein
MLLFQSQTSIPALTTPIIRHLQEIAKTPVAASQYVQQQAPKFIMYGNRQ